MKTILLMRHAKAEHDADRKDFDRRLTDQGIDDAARMGRTLEKLGAAPGLMVASPAARAKQTAEAAAKSMGFRGTIHLDRALYDASGSAWLKAVRALPEAGDSVLVVAHSPGIAEAAALLCGTTASAFDVPTAGILAFAVEAEKWDDVREGDAALRFFLRPKMLSRL